MYASSWAAACATGSSCAGCRSAGRWDVPRARRARRGGRLRELAEAGAALGHGSLVAIDERLSGDELLCHMWRFAASESCGTCVPCRVGCKRGLELAENARGRRPRASEREHRDALLDVMRAGSMCGFGRGVPRRYGAFCGSGARSWTARERSGSWRDERARAGRWSARAGPGWRAGARRGALGGRHGTDAVPGRPACPVRLVPGVPGGRGRGARAGRGVHRAGRGRDGGPHRRSARCGRRARCSS